jgi:RNA polymerase sigma-70 factor (ECF subfamily)
MNSAPSDRSIRESELVARRDELHAYCYRMLGSVHDADDALQEVMLRAWRGLDAFQGRSSLRSWLYRIATNVCLDAIAARPKRVLPVDYGAVADPHDGAVVPLAETTWVEPYPDLPEAGYELRESVELAFVAALQHLSANQRAVLILREVLDFSAREVAESLDTTTAAINSTLQRARKLIEERLPDESQQATLRTLGDEELRALVRRYAEALEQGDVDALLAMLTEDATWSMPPEPTWYRGHEQIAAFLHEGPMRVRWSHAPTRANGQPALGCYAWDEDKASFVPRVLDVLTLRGSQIAEVTAFLDPELFPRFGLPQTL